MIIDIVVGVVVLASALISFMRGFIREILTIAGVVGGILAAVFVGPMLAPIVRGWFGAGEDVEDPQKLFDIVPMEIVADATTYGTIFITVVIVISVLSHFMAGAASAVGLGPVDRTLGVIFGVIRAVILLALVYLPFHLLMDENRKDEFFKDSRTHYIIEKTASSMAVYLPESEEVEEEVKEKADEAIKQKLEEQNLLGTDKEKPEKSSAQPAAQPDQTGYEEEQREKLNRLFDEPAVNE